MLRDVEMLRDAGCSEMQDAQGRGDAQRMSQFAQAAAEETLPGCLLPEQPIGVTSRTGSGGSGDAGQGRLQPRKFGRSLCAGW